MVEGGKRLGLTDKAFDRRPPAERSRSSVLAALSLVDPSLKE